MADEMKPVLTAREVHEQEISRPNPDLAGGTFFARARRLAPYPDLVEVEAQDMRCALAADKLAALSLMGQPFGFTRDDVLDLAQAAQSVKREALASTTGRQQYEALYKRLEHLAVRIGALVPPKQD